MENLNKRTGFIAVVGRPNVGKSTLVNAMVGEKVSIVSKKPQTTRNRITGILTRCCDQFVFLDTPGMHTPRNKLGQFMIKSITSVIGEVDAAILVVEPNGRAGEIELNIIKQISYKKLPALLVINKIDLFDGEKVGETIKAYNNIYNFNSIIPVSAMKNKGVDIILDEAKIFLTEGEWLFDEDEYTDQPERQIASEIIREKLLRNLNDEIPHGIAVVIEEFAETKNLISIRAEIFCERESHKSIIIGKNGDVLKRVGTHAREDLEGFLGVKVYLNLWVKVKEDWRRSAAKVNNFGYKE